MTRQTQAGRVARGPATILDDLSFVLAKAYQGMLGLIQTCLAESGLERHVRPGAGVVLFALFESDGVVIKDIARRTELPPSTLTGLLETLERGGLVSRRRDASDGRAVRVALTRKGRALEGRFRQMHRQVIKVLLSGLSASEAAQTRRSLRRMIASMKAYPTA